MSKNSTTPLTIREKLACLLVLTLVKMIQPWEYEHQFTELLTEIKSLLKIDHE